MSLLTRDDLAALALVALICILALLAIWRYQRGRGYNFVQLIVYGYGHLTALLLWRAKVTGEVAALQSDQGGVIVCNHRGPFDPAFVQMAARSVVHWMVAAEYVHHPLLRWFFRAVEAIPVRRGGVDTAATKAALRYAKAGEWVGMLPEGRINMTDELLLSARPGVALVALRAQVPVVPCYVSGSPLGSTIFSTVFLPARAHLRVGKPLDLSAYYGRDHDKQVLEEVTLLLMKEIAKLAGHPEYEPTIAGRRWKPQ